MISCNGTRCIIEIIEFMAKRISKVRHVNGWSFCKSKPDKRIPVSIFTEIVVDSLNDREDKLEQIKFRY